MFYRHSPFHHYPPSNHWVPFLLSSPESSLIPRNSNAEIKENDGTSSDESIIYQDRGVRILNQNDSIMYLLDLPGIKVSDTKIEIRDGVLSVQAERKDGNNFSKYAQQFLVSESDLDSESITANMVDGVLTILIPKKEESKPISISIVAGYPPEKTDSGTNAIQFTVDVPGVKANDATLEVKRDTISLHATRKVFDKASSLDKYFSIDRSKVDPTSFNAYLADGVLTITGIKKDAPEPKSIAVSTTQNLVAIEEKKK